MHVAALLAVVVQAAGLEQGKGTSTNTGRQCYAIRCCHLELGSWIIVPLVSLTPLPPALLQRFKHSSSVGTHPWQPAMYVT
jgi:hypothetical protein